MGVCCNIAGQRLWLREQEVQAAGCACCRQGLERALQGRDINVDEGLHSGKRREWNGLVALASRPGQHTLVQVPVPSQLSDQLFSQLFSQLFDQMFRERPPPDVQLRPTQPARQAQLQLTSIWLPSTRSTREWPVVDGPRDTAARGSQVR